PISIQFLSFISSLFFPFTHSIFLYLSRVPRISTLFPYTTLFRSRRDPRGIAHRHLVAAKRHELRAQSRVDRVERRPLARRGDHRDRKSTRLNSSHVAISYAVFCLKKKKQTAIIRVQLCRRSLRGR